MVAGLRPKVGIVSPLPTSVGYDACEAAWARKDWLTSAAAYTHTGEETAQEKSEDAGCEKAHEFMIRGGLELGAYRQLCPL